MGLQKVLISVAALTASANGIDLSTFVNRERGIALKGAIANIGGTNNSLVGCGPYPGVVIASPSTVNPDYFYTWTRDSALTMNMVIDELIFGTKTTNNNSLQRIINDYQNESAIVQTVTNAAGTFYPAGQGLGDAKFYSNLTRYVGTWGRPQNDGPAFRASAFMEAAHIVYGRKHGPRTVETVYWPLIMNDLRYVGQYWNTTSYDPWEEVNGNSYFTTVAQIKALVQGQQWAQMLNTTCGPCDQIPELLCFLQSNFWNATGGYFSTDINANQVLTRSMLGTDPILGAIHTFDIDAPCNASIFQPCNSYMLATHKQVVDSFRNLYPINNNATAPAAVLVGRYPEDTYYDGNPWYLTTLACAEFLYDAVAQIQKAGQFAVDSINAGFVQDLFPCAQVNTTYSGTNLTYLTRAMSSYADDFVSLIQQHTPANGTLNEQINKTTGEPLSAIALTWSYASFVTMAERRAGQFPPSWGANSTVANTANTTCSPSSHNSTFTYVPAVAAGAPSTPQTYSNASGCLTEVLLAVNVSTMNGQNVYILGNDSVLGGALNNVSAIVLPLHTGNITADSPTWYVDNWYPAGQTVGYQYALQLGPGVNNYTLENQTRTFTAPLCGESRLYVPAGNISAEFGL